MKLFKGIVQSKGKDNKVYENEKAVVVGRLVRDPYVSEKATIFNIATVGKNNTEFPKIIISQEKSREFAAKYLKKGAMVAVIGNISTEEFDKKDGTKGTEEIIFSDNFQLVQFAPRTDGEEIPAAETTPSGADTPEEDLPF